MEATCQLTQKDFLDSLVAHRNCSPLREWSFRLMVILIFVVSGAGLIDVAMSPTRQSLTTVAPLFVLVALWAAVIWLSPRQSARKQFLQQPGAPGPRTVVLDATGAHWRWDGGSAEVEWKNYIQSLDSKGHFLLYTSPFCFNILPKRALTPDQVSEARALFAQNLPHKQ
jgi:hypothetical protein